MRRLLIAMAVFAVGAGAAAADEIWLKDGRSITTKKPVVTKGSNALITTADGVLVSVPLSEIDQAKTAEATSAWVCGSFSKPSNRSASQAGTSAPQRAEKFATWVKLCTGRMPGTIGT